MRKILLKFLDFLGSLRKEKNKLQVYIYNSMVKRK